MEVTFLQNTGAIYVTIWCHNPEDHNLNSHGGEDVDVGTLGCNTVWTYG
jgi:hypothetical protein